MSTRAATKSASKTTPVPEVLAPPEHVLSTLESDGSRRWIYPTLSKGPRNFKRAIVGWGLVLLFVALPLIKINGRPAILLDVVHREFTLFGTVFFPTDTLLLLLLGISGVLFVILITALLGRAWCGWACPQTVYMEFLFRPIERWIEGKEHVRARRDRGPWTFDKFWRKGLKFSIFGFLAFALAHVFVAYFAGWEYLISWMQQSPAEHPGFFTLMAGTTALIFFDFAYFREQMCTITCPYARMQSVLFDPDSLIVSYDPERGEPRGKASKKRPSPTPLGDCVDCFACVRTCPTGIDIRDGLQMECIACTQCIDACDVIMENLGRPKGLIRYTSENALEGRSSKFLRGRTVIYGLLFVIMISAFGFTLANRSAYNVNVARAVGAPFQELPNEQIANRLRFRVRNQTGEPASFTFSTLSPESLTLRVVGTEPVMLAPGEMKRIELWVMAPAEAFEGSTQLDATFALIFSDGEEVHTPFPLLGPTSP